MGGKWELEKEEEERKKEFSIPLSGPGPPRTPLPNSPRLSKKELGSIPQAWAKDDDPIWEKTSQATIWGKD